MDEVKGWRVIPKGKEFIFDLAIQILDVIGWLRS